MERNLCRAFLFLIFYRIKRKKAKRLFPSWVVKIVRDRLFIGVDADGVYNASNDILVTIGASVTPGAVDLNKSVKVATVASLLAADATGNKVVGNTEKVVKQCIHRKVSRTEISAGLFLFFFFVRRK